MTNPLILCVTAERTLLAQLRAQLYPALSGRYDIALAQTGEQALAYVDAAVRRGRTCPLVIVNQRVGGASGRLLLHRIQVHLPGIRSILLTTQTPLEAMTATLSAACMMRYLATPWREHDLLCTVHAALDAAAQHELLVRQSAYRQVLNDLFPLVLGPQPLTEKVQLTLERVMSMPGFHRGASGAMHLLVTRGRDTLWSCLASVGQWQGLPAPRKCRKIAVSTAASVQNERGSITSLKLVQVPICAEGQLMGVLVLQCEYDQSHALGLIDFLQSLTRSMASMMRHAGYQENTYLDV